MNGFSLAVVAGMGAVGFAASWTVQDIAFPPSSSLPPAIQINDITIRADGTTIYDRTILSGAGIKPWMAWSGQILTADGEAIHCSGGDLAQYSGPLLDPSAFDVDWLVGDMCMDGLEVGMKFAFTWTPIGPDYAPVRFPAVGYGTVHPALETE